MLCKLSVSYVLDPVKCLLPTLLYLLSLKILILLRGYMMKLASKSPLSIIYLSFLDLIF